MSARVGRVYRVRKIEDSLRVAGIGWKNYRKELPVSVVGIAGAVARTIYDTDKLTLSVLIADQYNTGLILHPNQITIGVDVADQVPLIVLQALQPALRVGVLNEISVGIAARLQCAVDIKAQNSLIRLNKAVKLGRLVKGNSLVCACAVDRNVVASH